MKGLMKHHYRCVVVDPPWDQGKTGKRKLYPNQGTDLEYPTMRPGEIAGVPVADTLLPQSFVWLWVTNSRSRSTGRPIIQHGFELLEEWGIRYYTMLTWDKRTGPCPFGPYQITTEHVLFGCHGKVEFSKERMGKLKTLFVSENRRRRSHSAKPADFYANVVRSFDGPRLDMFARQVHAGFDGWGDEYAG